MHRRCCLLGDQQATSAVHYTTSCKHSLVLLRMGEIIARIMLSWLKLLIKLLLSHLVGYVTESLIILYCLSCEWKDEVCAALSYFGSQLSYHEMHCTLLINSIYLAAVSILWYCFYGMTSHLPCTGTRDNIPSLTIRQGTDKQFYTCLSARTVQNELYSYWIFPRVLYMNKNFGNDPPPAFGHGCRRCVCKDARQLSRRTVPDGSGIQGVPGGMCETSGECSLC